MEAVLCVIVFNIGVTFGSGKLLFHPFNDLAKVRGQIRNQRKETKKA
jgi:hypothetical protein